MTKEQLKQYSLIMAEIDDLEYRRRKLCRVSDVVKGSYPQSPYTMHPISIEGVQDSDICSRYTKSINKLKQELSKIETYINGIDDSLVRQIMRYKYIDCLTWRGVAQKIGGGNKEDSLKKKLYRYLEPN